MKKLVVAAGAVLAFVGMAEVAARYAGLIDFPIYLANNRIGYIPAPSQSGAFMRSNDWVSNSLSMGIQKEFFDTPEDLLVVGDSIVWGGNPYRQEDKLPAQIQKAFAERQFEIAVWPIAAGSWAIVNEANWLIDHPEVLNATETLVFVVNAGDFGRPTSWRNPITHPLEPPSSALLYLVQKYIVKLPPPAPNPDLTVPEQPVGPAWAEAMNACECNVQIWLYPSRAEMSEDPGATALEANFLSVSNDIPEGVSIFRVREIPGWSEQMYRDTIHPSTEGVRVLADAIALASISHHEK